MKNANAFANEVERINLFVFDKDGKYVDCKEEKGDILKDESFYHMPYLPAGLYKFILIGGNQSGSFEIPELTKGISDISDLNIKLKASNDTVDYEINPLWHGLISEYHVTGEYQTMRFPIMKNTNRFRINLLQKNGELNINDFIFSIRTPDKVLRYDNTVVTDDTIVYKPYTWGQKYIITDLGTGGSAYAEFHTSRIIDGVQSKLYVYRKTDMKPIIEMDLNRLINDYKAEWHSSISLQEYLDRQDEYNFTFILDDRLQWLNTELIINDWIIRINNNDI